MPYNKEPFVNNNYVPGMPRVGLNHVGSYQTSCRPFVKTFIKVPISGNVSTATEIAFPKVTKFVTIVNHGDPTYAAGEYDGKIKIAFTRNGLIGPKDGASAGGEYNHFWLDASSSFSADFRVTRIYLMASSSAAGDLGTQATVIAGLTNIDKEHLSGSWEGPGYEGAGPY